MKIVSDWWNIAGVPALGPYAAATVEPLDFSLWKAADGRWQLGACVRGTACGGHGRLLYRWESPSLEQPDWAECGVMLVSEPAFGEVQGGLQAPYVIRHADSYYMFYGGWNNICLATSRDGKSFARYLGSDGSSALFDEGKENLTRDPMVISTESGFYIYYTAVIDGVGAILARTSADLINWSESRVVSRGGAGGSGPSDAECAFVCQRDGFYFLFRWHSDGNTSVYKSDDPLDFGVDTDDRKVASLPVEVARVIEDNGVTVVSSLRSDYRGIRLAHLQWDVGG